MHHDPCGDDRVWHEDLVLSCLISCIDRSKVASSLGPYRSAYKVAGPRNPTFALVYTAGLHVQKVVRYGTLRSFELAEVPKYF